MRRAARRFILSTATLFPSRPRVTDQSCSIIVWASPIIESRLVAAVCEPPCPRPALALLAGVDLPRAMPPQDVCRRPSAASTGSQAPALL